MAQPASHDDLLFPVDAVGALIAATGAILARVHKDLRRAVAPFAAALGEIHPASAVAPPLQTLAVNRHLPAALAAARGTVAEALAGAAGTLAAEAFWAQNPNYQRRPPDAGFLANYGYFVVAGPADGPPAFIETPSLALGLLLLGPGTLYPAHRHPAEELYIPLAGDGEWQNGDAPWRTEPAGAVIHHPSGVSHATRAGKTPLLAAYLWRGELATYARLSGR
jgi:hypothetical protein